jgi:hypothetical protein
MRQGIHITILQSLPIYIMSVALVGISVASNQYTHCYHPSGPQQGLQEGGILLWVVHLASQGGTTGNTHDHHFLIFQVPSSTSLTFHYYAH